MNMLRRWTAFAFAALLFAACDALVPLDAGAPDAPEIRLEAHTPAARGSVAPAEGLKSLLVLHEGRLVLERYYDGNRADSLNHVRSVTKSVVALLIGIALDEGFLQSTDQTIADFLTGVADFDAEKGAITIAQLMTMNGGFEWHETDGPEYQLWMLAPNQIQYVLDKPLVTVPGRYFNYNSGGTHLLSAILTEATGMSTKAFAETYLFGPMGITELAWETDKQGYYNGGAGLQLRPRDAAALGLMIAQEGRYDGRRIVPAAWVREATVEQYRLDWQYGPLADVDYGYLFWLDEGQAENVTLAWGYGGQFLYSVPVLDLLVVTTAAWAVSPAQKETQELAILDLIAGRIVPRFR